MCKNCSKRFTLEYVRQIALKHQKIEKTPIIIYDNGGVFNYALNEIYIPKGAVIVEVIEYE